MKSRLVTSKPPTKKVMVSLSLETAGLAYAEAEQKYYGKQGALSLVFETALREHFREHFEGQKRREEARQGRAGRK